MVGGVLVGRVVRAMLLGVLLDMLHRLHLHPRTPRPTLPRNRPMTARQTVRHRPETDSQKLAV